MELLNLFLNLHFLDDSETCLMLAVRPGKKISFSQAVLPTLDQSHAHAGGPLAGGGLFTEEYLPEDHSPGDYSRRCTCRRITRRRTIQGGLLAGGSLTGGVFTTDYLPGVKRRRPSLRQRPLAGITGRSLYARLSTGRSVAEGSKSAGSCRITHYSSEPLAGGMLFGKSLTRESLALRAHSREALIIGEILIKRCSACGNGCPHRDLDKKNCFFNLSHNKTDLVKIAICYLIHSAVCRKRRR